MKIRIKKTEACIFLSLLVSLVFHDYWLFYTIAQILLIVYWGITFSSSIEKQRYSYNLKKYLPYILFILFGLLSAIWSAVPSYAITMTRELVVIYLMAICLCVTIQTQKDIQTQLKLLFDVSIVLVIYLIIKTPISDWNDILFGMYSAASDEGRMGRSIGYHPNAIGTVFFLFTMVSAYWFSVKKSKVYLCSMAIFVVLAAFTKSRASLLMIIIGLIMFYLVGEKRKWKQVLIILGSVVAVCLVYWAIFNIPSLYNLFGFRFEGLFGNSGQQDASTLTRMRFFNYGIELFKDHPILGVGLDNYKYYSYYYNSSWALTYAHSNWAELLADTGIIGTGLYYVPQIIALVTLWKNLKLYSGDNRKMLTLFISIILVMIVFDIQKMSYLYFYTIYFSMLGIAVAKLVKRKMLI